MSKHKHKYRIAKYTIANRVINKRIWKNTKILHLKKTIYNLKSLFLKRTYKKFKRVNFNKLYLIKKQHFVSKYNYKKYNNYIKIFSAKKPQIELSKKYKRLYYRLYILFNLVFKKYYKKYKLYKQFYQKYKKDVLLFRQGYRELVNYKILYKKWKKNNKVFKKFNNYLKRSKKCAKYINYLIKYKRFSIYTLLCNKYKLSNTLYNDYLQSIKYYQKYYKLGEFYNCYKIYKYLFQKYKILTKSKKISILFLKYYKKYKAYRHCIKINLQFIYNKLNAYNSKMLQANSIPILWQYFLKQIINIKKQFKIRDKNLCNKIIKYISKKYLLPIKNETLSKIALLTQKKEHLCAIDLTISKYIHLAYKLKLKPIKQLAKKYKTEKYLYEIPKIYYIKRIQNLLNVKSTFKKKLMKKYIRKIFVRNCYNHNIGYIRSKFLKKKEHFIKFRIHHLKMDNRYFKNRFLRKQFKKLLRIKLKNQLNKQSRKLRINKFQKHFKKKLKLNTQLIKQKHINVEVGKILTGKSNKYLKKKAKVKKYGLKKIFKMRIRKKLFFLKTIRKLLSFTKQYKIFHFRHRYKLKKRLKWINNILNTDFKMPLYLYFKIFKKKYFKRFNKRVNFLKRFGNINLNYFIKKCQYLIIKRKANLHTLPSGLTNLSKLGKKYIKEIIHRVYIKKELKLLFKNKNVIFNLIKLFYMFFINKKILIEYSTLFNLFLKACWYHKYSLLSLLLYDDITSRTKNTHVYTLNLYYSSRVIIQFYTTTYLFINYVNNFYGNELIQIKNKSSKFLSNIQNTIKKTIFAYNVNNYTFILDLINTNRLDINDLIFHICIIIKNIFYFKKYFKRRWAYKTLKPYVVPWYRRHKGHYNTIFTEKKQLKYYYSNLKEKQLNNVYKRVKHLKENTGINMLILLECRLDSIIYKLNYVNTFPEARYFIRNKNVYVNDKLVTLASIQVKPQDLIRVKHPDKIVYFEEINQYIKDSSKLKNIYHLVYDKCIKNFNKKKSYNEYLIEKILKMANRCTQNLKLLFPNNPKLYTFYFNRIIMKFEVKLNLLLTYNDLTTFGNIKIMIKLLRYLLENTSKKTFRLTKISFPNYIHWIMVNLNLLLFKDKKPILHYKYKQKFHKYPYLITNYSSMITTFSRYPERFELFYPFTVNPNYVQYYYAK